MVFSTFYFLYFFVSKIKIKFQNYEARIDALQKQVEEQSMTMSMYSSYTPEDFNNIEEDIFGENSKYFSLQKCSNTSKKIFKIYEKFLF